jgi:hypothetical protein
MTDKNIINSFIKIEKYNSYGKRMDDFINIISGTKNNIPLILSVLNNLKFDKFFLYSKKELENINKKYKNKTIEGYFNKKYFGLGYYIDNHLVAYCFVKNPTTRPETMTVVHKNYRNKGIAERLRNQILKNRDEFVGNVVYSSVKLNNPASLKSVIKSGYTVFDVTKDGFVQLIKILPYK